MLLASRHGRHLKSGVYRILIENLDMRKLYAIWLPRLLAMEQKQRRVDVSIECLFDEVLINKDDFFKSIHNHK